MQTYYMFFLAWLSLGAVAFVMFVLEFRTGVRYRINTLIFYSMGSLCVFLSCVLRIISATTVTSTILAIVGVTLWSFLHVEVRRKLSAKNMGLVDVYLFR
jgi:CHASE2 domain-containing sensor protein